MPEPVTFPSNTQNLSLPLLLTGQAQKEFFVNQALSLLDGLWQRSVQGSISSPPETRSEGDCYRITAPATDSWAGHEASIAIWSGGAWQIIAPTSGLQIFDQAEGLMLRFDGQWRTGEYVAPPIGGATVDTEARSAIASLIEALQSSGILPHEGQV